MSIKKVSRSVELNKRKPDAVKSLGMEAIANERGNIVSIKKFQEEAKKTVSKQYKEARKELGITQKDLEWKTGIAQPNITRFESDECNPTLEMIVKMAAAIDMKVDIKFVPADRVAD